jgi:uncharacterized DUF497 family protein
MFEWDEVKRQRVLRERGLDFRDADLFFDGRPINHVPSSRNDEVRYASTAEINGKTYTLIWTWRAANQRIITFRRAHDAEDRAYREALG